jgi:DNA-binding PadR family transcriptional regulator
MQRGKNSAMQPGEEGEGRPKTSWRANFVLDIYIHTGYIQSVSSREIEDLLPLPEATFHILMAVAEDDRHGYAIIQDVATRTDGRLKLSPGTLYRSIQRMLEQGLIQETAERPAPELDDERRRYYRITAYGRAVANAEARRLAQLVRLARESGFVPGRA